MRQRQIGDLSMSHLGREVNLLRSLVKELSYRLDDLYDVLITDVVVRQEDRWWRKVAEEEALELIKKYKPQQRSE